MASPEQHLTICPLCEATCGLVVQTRGNDVTGVRGNDADVFSRGYICPKGAALKALHHDPDRLRKPLVRRGSDFVEVSWEQAFAEIARALPAVHEAHGRDAVAIYMGNPSVHNLAYQLYNPALVRALKTRNVYSASTLDQMPKHVASASMFGHMMTIAIPDIDRTDLMVMLGANPLVSNGSLMTAPDVKRRLRDMRGRGGRLVVIDPRRTRTAEAADEHHFIRPGTDAWLLLGMVATLFEEGLVELGRLAQHTRGVDEVGALARAFPPEVGAERCGIAAEDIRRLARDLAAAPRAVVYGRLGTCTQAFGTVTSWLVDVLNVLTGNLDREGGAMFPMAAAGARNTSGAPGRGKGMPVSAVTSRVRGWPQVLGELPTAALADEILTPGPGQVRALFTVAGNPALSAPGGLRLQEALSTLELMVSVDCYLNETTRHAHVILPPLSPLERPHYDVAFSQLAVHNVARWSPPVLEPSPHHPADWEVMLRLTAIASGQPLTTPLKAIDDFVFGQVVEQTLADPHSRVAGRAPRDLHSSRKGPARLLDFMLRVGPYGDAFGSHPDGLTLERLEAAPNGVDLGPLRPRIPEVLRTPSGQIELAPPHIVADVERLRRSAPSASLVLIGRRELRSNNSWMHNLPMLVKGPASCTLLVHPDDARDHGLEDGTRAVITSPSGAISAEVEITDAIMKGVVSLPHGWGHDVDGTRLHVAQAHPGTNVNALISETELDLPSGTVVHNAVPVTLRRA